MTDSPGIADPFGTALLDGRYRLLERVGSGGMGHVYRAHDDVLKRDVAVKLFHTERMADSETHRKIAEARVLASLNHASLVTLYDARVTGSERAYLVMEFVDGVTLRQCIDEGTSASLDVAALVVELATALEVVHAAGIVHRDVKPSNVLLRTTKPDTQTAVLADFGVAHLVDATRLTSPGTVIGTAAYLAPEQVRGEAPRPAADIYALGLLALETLTGRHPFGTDSIQATVLARLASPPAIPGELGYGWKSLLSAMTALDPAARPSAAEVAERAATLERPAAPDETAALTTAVDAVMAVDIPRHRRAHRPRAWAVWTLAGAAAVICAVVFGAFMATAEPPTTDSPIADVVATTTAEPQPIATPVEVAVPEVVAVPETPPVVPAPPATDPAQDTAVVQPAVTEVDTSNPNKGPGNNNGNGNGNGNKTK